MRRRGELDGDLKEPNCDRHDHHHAKVRNLHRHNLVGVEPVRNRARTALSRDEHENGYEQDCGGKCLVATPAHFIEKRVEAEPMPTAA